MWAAVPFKKANFRYNFGCCHRTGSPLLRGTDYAGQRCDLRDQLIILVFGTYGTTGIDPMSHVILCMELSNSLVSLEGG